MGPVTSTSVLILKSLIRFKLYAYDSKNFVPTGLYRGNRLVLITWGWGGDISEDCTGVANCYTKPKQT